MESLSTQLDQFSSNTQWISHEIQRIRKEMDSLTPKVTSRLMSNSTAIYLLSLAVWRPLSLPRSCLT